MKNGFSEHKKKRSAAMKITHGTKSQDSGTFFRPNRIVCRSNRSRKKQVNTYLGCLRFAICSVRKRLRRKVICRMAYNSETWVACTPQSTLLRNGGVKSEAIKSPRRDNVKKKKKKNAPLYFILYEHSFFF